MHDESNADGTFPSYRDALFGTLADHAMRARWPVLALAALLTGVFAWQSQYLEFDSSNEIWLTEGDPTLERMDKFKALFGNDDFVFVLYDAGDFFTREPIRRMAALAEDLSQRVPHLIDHTWLGNAEWIEGREASIEIDPLMDPLPQTDEELARARTRALSEPSFLDTLISRNGETAGLLLEMDTYPDDRVDPRKDVPPAVREVLHAPEHADLPIVAVGGPIVDYDLDTLTVSEGQRLFLICLAVQIAILAWVGGGLRGVLVPATVVVLGVVWTLGVIQLMGLRLNMTAMMVPVLLICVGIGDAMHVIAEFRVLHRSGVERRTAMRRAMMTVGWPCLLTSITTAVGFLSFLSADIQPFRELGVYSACGVFMAVALTFALVPALYSWGGDPSRPVAQGATAASDIFDRILSAAARLVTRHPLSLVVLFSALCVLSVVGYARVETETNVIKMFSERVPLRHDHDWVDARMGGSMSLEIMLDTGTSEGVLDPSFLRDMQALDERLNAHPLVTRTTSILDVLRKMRKAFHENRTAYYAIPESRPEAAQYMLLYEMSGGEDSERVVTDDLDVARLTVRTRSLGTHQVRAIVDEVETFAAAHFDDSVSLELTGTLAWARTMTDLVARGQRDSFLSALAVISLLMMAVLRSVRLGLVSMIPNVFPVLISLGLMGFAAIHMDLMLMIVSALIIGVAVDDTIHFFVRLRHEFAARGVYASSVEATLRSVGRPITFTTMTLSLGFAVLTASDVLSLGRFGLLAGFAFTWALLAAVLFAPALVILLKPLGPERPVADQASSRFA
ncbi:MAG: RND family transporter, partial [bacterium]|nr:RND family transporter [bacterium]